MPSLGGATRVASFSRDPGLVFEDPASACGRINIAVVTALCPQCRRVCVKKQFHLPPSFPCGSRSAREKRIRAGDWKAERGDMQNERPSAWRKSTERAAREAPGSPYIWLSGKVSSNLSQIPNDFSLKSSIPDRVYHMTSKKGNFT